MRFKVVKKISIYENDVEIIIPVGEILYKIPGDHLGNEKYVDYYNWNNRTIKLDRDTDTLIPF